MKLFFYAVFAFILFSSVSSLAEEGFTADPQLPSCSIDTVEVPCTISSSDGGGMGYLPIVGCSITCPADKTPVCNAGRSNQFCHISPVSSKCECK